jgi:membrane-associated phospholipid phosphatase
MNRYVVLIVLSLVASGLFGQKSKDKREKVYKMNYWVDVPVTAGLFATYYFGLEALTRKTNPDSAQVVALNKEDIWWFDRVALYQDVNTFVDSRNVSDYGLRIAGIMPFFLLIDRRIRRDWYDFILLYLETQSVAQNLYLLGGPLFTERIRPFAYYDELSVPARTGDGTTDSWFSGHTSTTATASFFMAKVVSDYHPELGKKKWWLFAAALIPPAFVGVYRIRALKHFPTDVIMGTAVGAAVGILIPHFHKMAMKKNKNLSVVPFTGGYSGLAMSYKF